MDFWARLLALFFLLAALLWQDSRIARLEMHFCHHAQVPGEYYTECQP
jgi:hypothetical protein